MVESVHDRSKHVTHNYTDQDQQRSSISIVWGKHKARNVPRVSGMLARCTHHLIVLQERYSGPTERTKTDRRESGGEEDGEVCAEAGLGGSIYSLAAERGRDERDGAVGRGQGRKVQSAVREQRRGSCKGSPQRDGVGRVDGLRGRRDRWPDWRDFYQGRVLRM